MRCIWIGLLAAGLAAGLLACTTTEGGQAGSITLEGTVAYRERMALPPDARIAVEVRDVSRQDTASILIASTAFAADGRQVPIPFSLTYDAARIEPRNTYAVSAHITDPSGELMFITDTRVPLPPSGETVALNLVRTGAGAR
jgi:putative lipoprotein